MSLWAMVAAMLVSLVLAVRGAVMGLGDFAEEDASFR